MTLDYIVQTYGYAAIVIGTFLEGETILVVGGFLAHRGFLQLSGVIGAAFIGSLLGDQLYFFLGRRNGKAILERRASWQPRAEKATKLLQQYSTPIIIGFRFLYGLRTITPFIIGMSSVSVFKFLLLNTIGAIVWAVIVGVGGYLFGHAIEIVIADIKNYELEVIAVISLIGGIIWLIHFIRKHREKIRAI
jgi:membrane protein DedA with SNARE-associated domain